MNLSIQRDTEEHPDVTYDGRNGFPTVTRVVFKIVETAICFDQEVTRVLATTTEEKFAKMIVAALNGHPLAFPPGVR